MERKKTEKVSVLGSTGSIGRNALQVVEKLSHRFEIVGLAAGRNLELLQKQIEKFKPQIVSVQRKEDAQRIQHRWKGSSMKVSFGPEGTEEVARFEENDVVVSAITGINGLRSTFAAVKTGKKVALANKESMVVGGALIQQAARYSGAQIVPVDSEHSGIFQCVAQEKREYVKKVILTASGGPFFNTPFQKLKEKTLEDTLQHPRWNMGEKVTIDSATMMNKGLELLEAAWLFGLQPEQLDVLIHPQSVVHSLVEMRDGSILAQLSPTDMKIPIQYALTYPHREEMWLPSLRLSQIKSLEFYDADTQKFPLLGLAQNALKEGGSFPVALNAANEIIVDFFRKRRIKFIQISPLVREIVEKHPKREVESFKDIFEIDREVREEARNLIEKRF